MPLQNECVRLYTGISLSVHPSMCPSVDIGQGTSFCQSSVLGINALPERTILGSSHLAANKDMMSKIWNNGDTII